MASGKARILLVDDEAALARLMQTILTRSGYHVDVCGDAENALTIFEGASEPYDVVIADLTLPGMSGQDLALKLLETNSSLKVLLCSGYPISIESLPEEVQHRAGYLQKPFFPNMLSKALDELSGPTD